MFSQLHTTSILGSKSNTQEPQIKQRRATPAHRATFSFVDSATGDKSGCNCSRGLELEYHDGPMSLGAGVGGTSRSRVSPHGMNSFVYSSA